MPTSNNSALSALQSRIWSGSLPLEIRLAPSDCRSYAESDPYLIQFPRLSYLAFLLPRLHAFFDDKLIDPATPVNDAWLEFEGVPLKWHYPAGLLYDLYSGAEPVDLLGQEDGEEENLQIEGKREGPLPWRLVVHYAEYPGEQLIQLDTEGRVLLDMFINAVKEADFVRNGSARTVMGMSREDSEALWRSVETHDLVLFNTINTKLLNPPGVTIRHIALKIYLPSSATQGVTSEPIPEEKEESSNANANPIAPAGHIRVVQSLVPLQLPSKLPQTMGTALASVIPAIFPSRRKPIYAQPVLHGIVVPLAANLGELGRVAGYADGFLHVSVVMMG